ncbi:MAG TPA: hypothetical protein VHP31_09180 [Caproicibacter sp.]|nr:hypothetical protein [Caproicibacter sp.]
MSVSKNSEFYQLFQKALLKKHQIISFGGTNKKEKYPVSQWQGEFRAGAINRIIKN